MDAENIGSSSTSSYDTRLTNIGKMLRRFKLDELPQLINIIKGDMSFVGYRPQVQWAVDLYTEEERAILQLQPGITDWASIKFYNEEEIIAQSGMADPDEAYMHLIHPEKTRLQIKYLKEHTFFLDIKIIIATILTVIATRMGFKPVGLPRN